MAKKEETPDAQRSKIQARVRRPPREVEHGMRAGHAPGRAILGLLALLPVAHAGGYPDYVPLAASQYPSYQEQQGIGLAVVPLLDKSSQKRYFGENLLAQGFLPVYVVIENHASQQSAILLRDRIVYKYDDSPVGSGGQQQTRPDASAFARNGAWLAAEWGSPVAMTIFFHSVYGQRMNLLAKQLQSQTVSPGKTGGGFVFVAAGKGGKSAREVFLNVPVKGGPSDQDINFQFRIEMEGGKK
jgi:hypothetical protein